MSVTMHYGPWEVTVTDGDTAMRHEVYAATEEQACAEVMEHSDLYVSGPGDDEMRDVRVWARRLP